MSDIHFDQLLFTTPMGDKAYFHNESLVVSFSGKRSVVSTSNLNGGYRNDLKYVFNHSCGRNPLIQQKRCPGMKGKNIAEHYAITASEIGLPVDLTTGMGTAALIENTVTATRKYYDVEVMAVATAGIDVNGGRAGDPAAYDEFAKASLLPPAGTINVFLFVNAHLDAGALTRAIVTVTEAKTAALQELMAVSMYSQDLATGSGTDSVIVVGNDESETWLYNAGKHVLLGEMIGQSVKEAVKGALSKQTGMTPQRQSSVEWQCKRYGMTRDKVEAYVRHICAEVDLERLKAQVECLDRDPSVVPMIFAAVHLVDQHRWGMLSVEAMQDAVQSLVDVLVQKEGCESLDLRRERRHALDPSKPIYEVVISDLILLLSRIALRRIR